MAGVHSHHGSLLSLDVLAAHSGLRDVSPGLKTAFSIVCLLLCVAAADLVVGAAVAASMMCIIWRMNRVPLRRLLRMLRIPVLFLALNCVVILLELPREPIGFFRIQLGARWLCITESSLFHAGTLFFQALGAVCCLYFLSTSTPMPQLIGVLRRCRLPELMIELMYLIYRYLFVLLGLQQQMTQAATVRLGYVNLRRSLSTAGRVSGGVLAASFRRSGACLDAMESRGYNGKLTFLSHTPKLRLRHALAAAAYAAALGVLILLRKGGHIL